MSHRGPVREEDFTGITVWGDPLCLGREGMEEKEWCGHIIDKSVFIFMGDYWIVLHRGWNRVYFHQQHMKVILFSTCSPILIMLHFKNCWHPTYKSWLLSTWHKLDHLEIGNFTWEIASLRFASGRVSQTFPWLMIGVGNATPSQEVLSCVRKHQARKQCSSMVSVWIPASRFLYLESLPWLPFIMDSTVTSCAMNSF